MEHTDFKTFFFEKLKQRGISLKKLSELSGISLKHLENLSEENFHALPPAPYFRGYLKKVGEILGFEGESWWSYFSQSGLIVSSGISDALPHNRFANKPVGRYLWFGILIALIIAYGIFRLPAIVGSPLLEVNYPEEEITRTDNQSLSLYGVSTKADQLNINEEPVPVGDDGRWERTITLEPGLNTIQIRAKKFLGRETTVLRQVIYEPFTATTTTPLQQETSTLTDTPADN